MDVRFLKENLDETQYKAVKYMLESFGYDPGMCMYRLSERKGIPYMYLDVYFHHLLIRLRVNSKGECEYDGTYARLHEPLEMYLL